ncbi:zinc finger protein 492-like [Maniola jurtina]|uniref:zinc finger protein 492-like n=1 Tax=Maniola jurtina TaxID=191418 RepID=UPI001E6864C5|nr:zinc finger protein 492-like [Maniola jurtina]
MNPIINIACEFNTNENFIPKDVDSGFIDQDPLDGLGVCNEEKFNKLDQVVFADPINYTHNNLNTENDDNIDPTFTFLDKVTVEKRVGKRNKYHIELEDVSNPVCPEKSCQRKFSTITLLKAHIRKVHCSVQRYTCEFCGLSFTAKYLLNRHTVVHERSKVQCLVCKRMLSKRTNLSVHMRFVHRQGELKCDKCDQRFEKRSQYTRHKSSHKV